MGRSQNKFNLAIIICIVFVALIPRLWHLGSKNLSYDEGFSLHCSTPPLSNILLNVQEQNPPLYYALLHGWVSIFGDSELAIRFLSVAFGIIAILLTGWVAHQIGGRSLAFISMGLLAIMPMPVEYSQIARTYSCFLALSIGSYGCLLKWERNRQRRWRAAYALTTIIMCYAHNYAVFNIISQNVYLAWQVYRRRIPVREWMHLSIPVILWYLPWLFAIVHQMRSTLAGGYWIPRLNPLILLYAPHFFVTRYLAPELVWFFSALAGFGLLRIVQTNDSTASRYRPEKLPIAGFLNSLACRKNDGLLLLWFACPLVIPFAWSSIGTPVFWPRYTIAAAPAFAILVSQGILGIPNKLMRFVIACLLAGIAATSVSRYHAKEPEAWRPLVRTIESLIRPGDVLTISDRSAQWVFRYYYRGTIPAHPLPATIRTRDQAAIQESIQEIVAGQKRLWMVIFPEPYSPGPQINQMFSEQYPQATLMYSRTFPGSPGALYLLGYDLERISAKPPKRDADSTSR